MITCLTRQIKHQSKQDLEDGQISHKLQQGSRDLDKAADKQKCAADLISAAGAAKHTAVLVYVVQPYAQQKTAVARSNEHVECACHVARYATALHHRCDLEGKGGRGWVSSDEFTFSSPSAAFLHAAMISSYEASFCSLTVRSTTLTSTVGTCNSQAWETSLNCRGKL